jgi:GTP cyclohydrolase IA
LTTDKKSINRKKVARLVRQLLIELGENPDREGLTGTPNRIAGMYEEIFGGYRMDAQLDVSFSEETEAVIAKDIQFYSMCEHHMLPF